jgi:antitoxin component of MazEF toxin-antitoxin module
MGKNTQQPVSARCTKDKVLEELCAKITDKNKHANTWENCAFVGNEIW